MELLARIILLTHLFLFVKFYMDPIVIVDIKFFVFHWVQLWFEQYLLFLHKFFFKNVTKLPVKWSCWQEKKVIETFLLVCEASYGPIGDCGY